MSKFIGTDRIEYDLPQNIEDVENDEIVQAVAKDIKKSMRQDELDKRKDVHMGTTNSWMSWMIRWLGVAR